MRRPRPDDAELKAAIRRYVVPETDGTARYLWLLGAGFAHTGEPARTVFLRQLAAAARQASDRELATLLDSEWRSRLTASWLIGLDRREQYRTRIGEQLLSSELTYAGQGYCFALARFATSADADLLAAYLDTYLPQLGQRYDQPWAQGALLHVDEQLSTDYAARFIAAGGLWQQWDRLGQTPAQLREWISDLCALAEQSMRPD
jgi:hypothetical protein